MRSEDDGFDSPTAPLCGCGAAARGQVDDEDAGPHWCRQCSSEHCELARYVRGQDRRRGLSPGLGQDRDQAEQGPPESGVQHAAP
jgi:hypothetical protein